jgi:uncharacterized membrane protein YuzA (DUF378 family)
MSNTLENTMDTENYVFDKKYTHLLVQQLAYGFMIFGAIVCLIFGAANANIITGLFGEGLLSSVIFTLIGFAGLYFLLQRDYYLPFLGETVMPCSVLEDRTPPGADREVAIKVAPGAKVLYWAAEPSNEDLKNINDWKDAYAKFDNVGVTTADDAGNVVLKVRTPQPYTVPFKGRIEPHVHYRVCEPRGMIGRVNTVFVSTAPTQGGPAMEGFYSSTNLRFAEGFQGQSQKATEKAIHDMAKVVPQINQIMQTLQTQFAMDASQPAVLAQEDASEISGQTVEEAFRLY